MAKTPNNKNGTINDLWSIEKAADLYSIPAWGADYFSISKQGEVLVTPSGQSGSPSVSIVEIVAGLKERGFDSPILLRFEEILASRIRILNESFLSAIREYNYEGTYRGVYPIKVNQQQQVIEELTTFGAKYHHGLEAGSKAELIAALAYLQDPEALLICNGYKDRDFIDLGLNGRKIGLNCVFVIETLAELPLILERSRKSGVVPVIGVRIKLSSKGSGTWKESGGDRSVFGLNTAQVIQVVDRLREEGMLDCLKLMHYHLGSQIPNIRDIRSSVVEACRIYAGLVNEGAPLEMLDLGGGLAVDYDGSHTNFSSSCNYHIDEYCRDIIEVVKTILDETGIAHPSIITESGRATVAYYSVLIFNILDVARFKEDYTLPDIPPDVHENTSNLYETATSLNLKNLQENFHDAIFYRDEIRELFRHGNVSIRERAFVEEIFWQTLSRIQEKTKDLKYVPDDFKELESSLADIYYGNLSVFQSLPDVWAIAQLFPILPIHRLDERPTRDAIIADITCDCDGKIDSFVGLQDIKKTIKLHEVRPDEDYLLGVFLVGAYQETLGDLHNLLGDTHVASVRLDESGKLEFVRETEGDTVEDVLNYVEYDSKELIRQFRKKAEKAVRDNRISVPERRAMMEAFRSGLRGYTYFET